MTLSCFAQISKPVGINLAGVKDWSSEFVFVDIMNQSREWIAHDLSAYADWDSGVHIPLRTDGYPVEVPYDNGIDPPQGVRTLLYFGELEEIYPGGEYTLKVDGSGSIQVWGAANGYFDCPLDTTINVDHTLGGIAIEIAESLASNPIHNIQMIMPGFEQTYTSDPFHPQLLEFLQDFQVIRFMDWMETNNSPLQNWTDRTPIDYYTQTLHSGVAYEHMIDLCNRLQKDAWVNIPHQASDQFIREFARLLRDNLDPTLTIYLEYSNEVWNEIFDQNAYAALAGEMIGIEGEPWERSWAYTSKRSVDVFTIFEQEFVDDGRFVKVLPGFAFSPFITEFIIDSFNDPTLNPEQIEADGIAVAPYFGGALADDLSDQGLDLTITIDAFIDSLALRLEDAFMYMELIKSISEEHDMELFAYEGGQHVVANFPNNQDSNYVNLLLNVNRHPMMKDFYCEYLEYWYNTLEGGLFCHFSSHGGYSQFGAWGLKETYDDIDAPKYSALKECVFDANEISSTNNLVANEKSEIQLYPTLVSGLVTINNPSSSYSVTIYDSHSALVDNQTFDQQLGVINMGHLPQGIYIVKVANTMGTLSKSFTVYKL